MRRALATLAMLAMAATLSAPAHAAALPAAITSRGILQTAVVPNYPPLEFRDSASGTLTGFDIELGDALAAKLGVKMGWQETNFEQMLSSVKTGRLDIVLSGMSDLPARRDTVDFIDYLRSGVQFFTQASHAQAYGRMTALCGKSVGASRRTSLPGEIKTWSDAHCVAARLPPINVVGTEGSADARTQLRQGRIDAAVQGSETLPFIMKNEPNTYAAIGEPIRWTLIGIAVGKDQVALRDALSQALGALMADGTYRKLLDKWQLGPNGVAAPQLNQGQ
ncbi:ABC transporter substrate-binding protein [Robbsia sp. Bb-Pol-6]|uniref:ABC transporter substrate-binding protein n=1 Tax=Robbsia betulipollinis TaxID=2981849 RepID=A0ABT3ZSX7_9BURK|nr:ABC transporter substrate-binding protein [Robbsia betulipollinis]MCY0389340.1 ABC transporter substrate-binding protein [Robbsia betulipollinis]